MTETARLRHELFDARKEIESHGAKLSSLKKAGDKITAIMNEVKTLLQSITKAQERHHAKDAQTRQREAEMDLVKKRKKPPDLMFVSTKKELVGVMVENASLRWSRGNVDKKIKAR